MPLRCYLLLLVCCLFNTVRSSAANLVVDSVWLEKRNRTVGANAGLNPGDTLFLKAGNYQNIVLKQLVGSPDKPIVVVNFQGVVRFSHEHYRGAFNIKQCRYLQVRGLRWNGLPGYLIERAGTGSAIGINDKSSDIILSGFKILHAGFAGIMIKTDPDCDSTTWQSNYLMKNIIVEDNYISGTGGEGIYAGNTASVRYISCGTSEVKVAVKPHLISGLIIRRNRIDSTGADGLQIALAPDAIVEQNYISRYGLNPFEPFQNSGIQLGGGSSGVCRLNHIENGSGNGISAIGIIGGNKIMGNVICRAGGHGIFLDNRSDFLPINQFVFLEENEIIAPKLDGIRTYAEVFIHKIKRNSICGIRSGSTEIESESGVKIIDEE